MKTPKLQIMLALLVMAAAILACGGQTSTAIPATSAPEIAATDTSTSIPPTNTPSGPTASDFTMSSDKAGNNQATVFSPTDTIYVHFTIDGASLDTKVIGKWYVLDVSGIDPTQPALTFTSTVGDALGGSPLPAGSSVTLDLHINPKPGGTLPAGHWKVDIFLDDVQVGEQTFSIQQ